MSDGFFSQLSGRQITLAREYDAPIALVYRVFVEPQHVVHWWGPFGFTNTIETMDARPGGVWRFTMHVGNGQTYPNVIHFHEVVAEQKLRFTHGSGVEGEPTFDVEITFEALGPRKTRVTLQQQHASEARAKEVSGYAIPGGRQTLTRLIAYLDAIERADAEGSVIAERAFDADGPRVIAALRALAGATVVRERSAQTLELRTLEDVPVIAALASVDGRTQLFVRSASSAAESTQKTRDERAVGSTLAALLTEVGAKLATTV